MSAAPPNNNHRLACYHGGLGHPTANSTNPLKAFHTHCTVPPTASAAALGANRGVVERKEDSSAALQLLKLFHDLSDLQKRFRSKALDLKTFIVEFNTITARFEEKHKAALFDALKMADPTLYPTEEEGKTTLDSSAIVTKSVTGPTMSMHPQKFRMMQMALAATNKTLSDSFAALVTAFVKLTKNEIPITEFTRIFQSNTAKLDQKDKQNILVDLHHLLDIDVIYEISKEGAVIVANDEGKAPVARNLPPPANEGSEGSTVVVGPPGSELVDRKQKEGLNWNKPDPRIRDGISWDAICSDEEANLFLSKIFANKLRNAILRRVSQHENLTPLAIVLHLRMECLRYIPPGTDAANVALESDKMFGTYLRGSSFGKNSKLSVTLATLWKYPDRNLPDSHLSIPFTTLFDLNLLSKSTINNIMTNHNPYKDAIDGTSEILRMSDAVRKEGINCFRKIAKIFIEILNNFEREADSWNPTNIVCLLHKVLSLDADPVRDRDLQINYVRLVFGAFLEASQKQFPALSDEYFALCALVQQSLFDDPEEFLKIRPWTLPIDPALIRMFKDVAGDRPPLPFPHKYAPSLF